MTNFGLAPTAATGGTVPARFPQTKPNSSGTNGLMLAGKREMENVELPVKRSLSGMLLQRASNAATRFQVQPDSECIEKNDHNTATRANRSNTRQPQDAHIIQQGERLQNATELNNVTDPVRTFANVGSMARKTFNDCTGLDMVGALRRVASTSIPNDSVKNITDRNTKDVSNFSSPPLDWSIKSSIRISSPTTDFSWATSIHASVEVDALQEFASSEAVQTHKSDRMYDTNSGPMKASLLQQFRCSTLGWVHPIDQLPSTVLAAMNTGSDSFLSARRMSWRRAFRSLYFSLRIKKTGLFYLNSSECTALFLSEDLHQEVRGSFAKGPCVLIVHQRSGVREALNHASANYKTLDEDIEVRKLEDEDDDADVPLDLRSQGHATDIERKDIEEEDEEDIRATNNGGAENQNRKLTNGIVFSSGLLDVNVAFDVLFNYLGSHSIREDVPQLLSPSPFLGATLSQASVRSGKSKRACADGSMDTLELLEIEGILLPWNIQRSCKTIQDACISFDVFFKSTPIGLSPQLNMGFARLRLSDEKNIGSRKDNDNLHRQEDDEMCAQEKDAFIRACNSYMSNNLEDSSRPKELSHLSWSENVYKQ